MLIYNYKFLNPPSIYIFNQKRGYSKSTDPSTGHAAYTQMHMDAQTSTFPWKTACTFPAYFSWQREDEGTPPLHAFMPTPQLVNKPSGDSPIPFLKVVHKLSHGVGLLLAPPMEKLNPSSLLLGRRESHCVHATLLSALSPFY